MIDEDQFGHGEDLAMCRYGITLDEIARAKFDIDVELRNDLDEEDESYITGECRFYFPIDTPENTDRRSFNQRVLQLFHEGVCESYGVRSTGFSTDKRRLNEMLRNSESFKKTKMFSHYLKRSGKVYPVIVLEGYSEEDC